MQSQPLDSLESPLRIATPVCMPCRTTWAHSLDRWWYVTTDSLECWWCVTSRQPWPVGHKWLSRQQVGDGQCRVFTCLFAQRSAHGVWVPRQEGVSLFQPDAQSSRSLGPLPPPPCPLSSLLYALSFPFAFSLWIAIILSRYLLAKMVLLKQVQGVCKVCARCVMRNKSCAVCKSR